MPVIFGAAWNRCNEWVGKFPSTNGRILVSIAMEILYVTTLLACVVFGRVVQVEVAGLLGAFILGCLGIDYRQFGKKRDTHQGVPTPPPQPASDPG